MCLNILSFSSNLISKPKVLCCIYLQKYHNLGPLYTRAWGLSSRSAQIMWLGEKLETVQVQFGLDLAGPRD